MKKSLVVLSVILFAAGLFLSACSKAETPGKAVELKLTTQVTPSARMDAYKEWAKKVEEKTDGEVKITIYPTSSLIGEQDVISGIKSGLTDMGDVVTALFGKQFPYSSILQLPFMFLGNPESCYQITMDLQEKFPEMKAEFKDFRVLFFSGVGDGGIIHTSKVAVREPKDLKGVKIMASGVATQVVKSIGASPVFMPAPDWYMSLERGLLQGIQLPWAPVFEMDLYKHLPYHTSFPSIANLGSDIMLMSIDTWNKLSPKAQKAFDELKPWITNKLMQIEKESNDKAIAAMKNAGQTIITLTKEDEKKWYEIAKPAHKAYLEKTPDSKRAQAIYDEAQKFAEKYKK